MKRPCGRRNSVASFSDDKTSSDCVKASFAQFWPTFGAPSWSTTSALRPVMSRFRSARHCGVVMSSWCVMTPRMGLIGIKSTPMIVEPDGMYLAAICSQPPGAAHRSTRTFALARKSYFLLSWMSLKALRAR